MIIEASSKNKNYPISKNIPNAETERAFRNAEKEKTLKSLIVLRHFLRIWEYEIFYSPGEYF